MLSAQLIDWATGLGFSSRSRSRALELRRHFFRHHTRFGTSFIVHFARTKAPLGLVCWFLQQPSVQQRLEYVEENKSKMGLADNLLFLFSFFYFSLFTFLLFHFPVGLFLLFFSTTWDFFFQIWTVENIYKYFTFFISCTPSDGRRKHLSMHVSSIYCR